MLDEYRSHEAERAALGIPPLPLSPEQVEEVVAALGGISAGHEEVARLRRLLTDRVSPGVGEAARLKARWLGSVARGELECPAIDPPEAVALLGTMLGGYNVAPLVELLEHEELGPNAAEQLAGTLLVYGAFDDVADRGRAGNAHAARVLRSWADMAWLDGRPPVPDAIELTVFKLDGETTTDDLSPATHAWSRADIPLHATSLLLNRLGEGVAIGEIARLKAAGRPVVFVGDVVGTGSSRKSAVNSLLWHIGEDIPFVPNKRRGGVIVAGRIAPIFRDTLCDSGALPIECYPPTAAQLHTGDVIVVRPHQGRIETAGGELLGGLGLGDRDLLEAVRAGGRIPLIIGRMLARKAGAALASGHSKPRPARSTPPGTAPRRGAGYTLAQKIVGKACDLDGVAPGTYCEPRVSTVGSQDTTGPMNKTELEDLACLSFGADLVLQTFCHTVAYPRPSDVETQMTLPEFMGSRGAVVLRPGDGIIHSWINQLLLPDKVGTGSDSHTRFPLGISFPAGSGLVAFAAAMGVMPLTMPESVRVRLVGERQPGITLRDVVNAIPYLARLQDLLDLDPTAGRNPFSGRIIEIEGLADMSVTEAFELADATAERSAAACTIALSEERVRDHLTRSLALVGELIDAGYRGREALERRAEAMEQWLEHPVLLRADADARYATDVEIDLSRITEPLLACPGNPDDVRPLSEIAGVRIDEVFVGSCMTNLGHFRRAGDLLAGAPEAVPVKLWIAPPTRMVEAQLRRDGYYSVFGRTGARTEIPGCSLCMGNQARVAAGATVVSTSTRNFPNRMGMGANVYLASAEVAAVAATIGRLPTVEEYRQRLSA
jgi:aconitate hydratase 2/2-methylisocitrate dehydratase